MSKIKKDLVPIEEKYVDFYGDALTAALVQEQDEARVYVPVRPICENLGLAWPSQYSRIKRDAVLSEAATSVTVTVTEAGQRGAMVCLPLKYLPGWLFGVSVKRVRPELQEKIIRYQREAYDVLWEAFQEGRLTAEPSISELLESDSPAAQAYKMASAIMQMARQQLLLESRLEGHESRLGEYELRLEVVEATLGDADRYLSNAQASRISQAVKAVALLLSKSSGRNEYGGVYGELYRRYDVASYRELPAGKYEDAMAWLTQWYQSLASDPKKIPF
jgi:hypothetical protein